MNAKQRCTLHAVQLVVMSIALLIAGLGLLSHDRSSAAQETTPTPVTNGDTLLIRSFPAGLPVFVVPADLANGAMGDIYVTSPNYLRGNTPLEIPVEPGEYRVTITHYDQPADFREDGEVSIMYVLGIGDDGQTVSAVTPGGKSYAVTKNAGQPAIVTALFWPKDQSLRDFVASLPQEELFDIGDEQFYVRKFQDNGIPHEDWPDL